MQVFADNPTAWRRRSELPDGVDEFRARLDRHDIGPLAVHAAYLINLAGNNDEFYERSIEVLSSELAIAAALGAHYVNVHVGSHRGSGPEAGTARVVDALERVLDHHTAAADHLPVLVFENGSGGGDCLGATVEELAGLLDAAGRRGLDARLGFCLDAAHLWGAGYDISGPAGVDAVVTRFDELVGIERLRMIHLNDSVSPLGSRHDRHTHVGAGEIGAAGLGRLLSHPSLDHVAYYVETPFMEDGFDAVNVGRMDDLAAGRELRPLPPEPEHPTRRPRFSSPSPEESR